jgi:hypothetical protein
VYKGKVLYGKIFAHIFAVIVLITALSILMNVIIPYVVKNRHESDLNYVVSVKTNNYKLNQSPEYPIGALKSGKNVFYLTNETNEKVKGFFVLKIKGMACVQSVLVSSENLKEIYKQNIENKIEYEIAKKYEIESHGGEFIYFTVSNTDSLCQVERNFQIFPISIISWKMVDYNQK